MSLATAAKIGMAFILVAGGSVLGALLMRRVMAIANIALPTLGRSIIAAAAILVIFLGAFLVPQTPFPSLDLPLRMLASVLAGAFAIRASFKLPGNDAMDFGRACILSALLCVAYAIVSNAGFFPTSDALLAVAGTAAV